jgi:hypothetical protein
VDVLYLISLRSGFEMTREHMTYVLQKFFAAFNRIYEDPSKMIRQGAPSEVSSDKSETEDNEGIHASLNIVFCTTLTFMGKCYFCKQMLYFEFLSKLHFYG